MIFIDFAQLRCVHPIHDVLQTGLKLKFLKFTKNLHNINLSHGGRRLLETPNAGGSSVISEVLSYEVLRAYLPNVELLYTETEIQYRNISKITDYAIKANGIKIGVSVTRCMKYRGRMTKDDCIRLLTKKLKGIEESTKNVIRPHRWRKQILHVWVEQKYMINLIHKIFSKIKHISPTTLIVLTVIESSEESKDLFYEHSAMKKFY